MGGAAFAAKGASTGQAPTTVFFGAVPDKYNLLQQLYTFDTGASQGTTYVSIGASTNISTWIPWDQNWGGGGGSNITASVGSTTTAPDGTNTGHHITEGTNTGYHIMVAGSGDGQLRVPSRKRLAVFAKKAERTRLMLMLGNYINLSGVGNRFEGGVRCIFDLAGGQIGVAPTVITGGFTYNYTALGSGIIPYGNGWYLCYIDVSLATNGNPPFNSGGVLQGVVGPDAGSGTGSANFKYLGDGASGIYVWNTSLLPPRAWGLNTTVFFDDFPNLNSIDVNNTLAPGFKWYVAGNTWPEHDDASWWTPITPGALTVTSSVLKVPDGASAGAPFGTAPNPMTAAYTGGTNYVGNVWVPPFVMEWKGGFDQSSLNTDELAYWSLSVELMMTALHAPLEGQFYHEVDIVDSGAAGAQYSPNFGYLQAGNSGGLQDISLIPWAGYLGWLSAFTYKSGDSPVFWNGNFYTSLVNSNTGNQPDLTVGVDWSLISAPTNPTGTGIFFNATTNVYTFMRLPDFSRYAPFDDTGSLLLFSNGTSTFNAVSSNAGEAFYGANVPLSAAGQSNAQNGDGYHYFMILGSAGRLRAIFADYVKVIQ